MLIPQQRQAFFVSSYIMRPLKIITIIFLFCVSCDKERQNEIYSDGVELLNPTAYETYNFNDSYFSKNFYSFRQNVIRDKTGKLNYFLPDGTVDNSHLDSTKYFHTAQALIVSDKFKYPFRFCRAKLIDKTILLHFTDSLLSNNTLDFDFIWTDSSMFSSLYQNYSITDSSYVPPKFETLWNEIYLNKRELKVGDSIKGKFISKIKPIHFMTHNFYDTLKIYGLIKTIVE